jgi:amino acid permease
MRECPNSDPKFDKVMAKFFDISAKDYPSNRKKVFYGICIWVRLALYYYIYKHKDEKYIPYVVGALAIGSIMHLKSSIKNPGRQWWSKRFDLVISVLLLLSCIGVVNGKIPSVYIPNLLFLSLASGIFQSLSVTFC